MKSRYPIAVLLLILLSVLCWAGPSLHPIHAAGETSTRFGVFVLHHDGSTVFGRPQAVGAAIQSSPALGEVDGNGRIDVVAASYDGRLIVAR